MSVPDFTPIPLLQVNRFLLFGGQEWEKPGNKLYATFEQAEVVEGGLFSIRFSAASAVDHDRLFPVSPFILTADSDIASSLAQLPIFIIEVKLTGAAVAALSRDGRLTFDEGDQLETAGAVPDHANVAVELERLERRWLVLELAEGSGGVPAFLFGNLFGEPRQIRLASAAPVDDGVAGALHDSDPISDAPDASVDEIESALSNLAGGSSVEGIAFYDVGQGTAQGLLAGHRPAAYADFGGGAAFNKGTFPPALTRFCFSAKPPIILSHWDEDHWSSGGRDTRSYGMTWIAPRPVAGTTLGFAHRAHASAVIAHGTLLIWPPVTPAIKLGQVTLLKCTGTSRNSSGIAMEIAPPGGTSGKPVLLPADAGYDDLPKPHASMTSAGTPYDAVACPHHGGWSNSPAIPTPPAVKHARLAYSYGPGNTYTHPLTKTWRDHDAAGWVDARNKLAGTPLVRNTEDRSTAGLGHIGFDWGAGKVSSLLPCGGSCHLAVQQT